MPYTVLPPLTVSDASPPNFGAPRIVGQGALSPSDMAHIIQARAAAFSAPSAALLSQQQAYTQRAQKLGKVAEDLTQLSQSAAEFKNTYGILSPSASTSDAQVLLASAGVGAQQATHLVAISNLATGQINQSQTFASPTSSPLADANSPGQLTLQTGQNQPYRFEVSTQTTLASLADAINTAQSGVQASLVSSQSGVALELTSRQTGASQNVSISESGLTLHLADHLLQSAADASGTIDGTAFSSSTNTLSGALPGVTLSLLEPSAAPVSVTVTDHPVLLSNFVSSFVAAYNAVIDDVATMQDVDVGLAQLNGQLVKQVSSASQTATGAAKTLAEVGITLDSNNHLVVDSNQLNQSIAQDAQGVATLFADGPFNTTAGVADQVAQISQDFGAPIIGTLSQMAQSNQQAASSLQSPIDANTYAANQMLATLRDNLSHLQVGESELAAQNLEVGALLGQTDPLEPLAPTFAPTEPPYEAGVSEVGQSDTGLAS